MLVAPQQQLQSVVGLRQFAFTFGNIGTGAFDDPAGLLQCQDIGAAGQQLFLDKGVGTLLVLQRLLRHLQLSPGQALVEIALRDIRD